MTRYDSAAWAKKARKRKAYRDHVRDDFFKKTQAIKHAEPQDMVGSPSSQSDKVVDLLKLRPLPHFLLPKNPAKSNWVVEGLRLTF